MINIAIVDDDDSFRAKLLDFIERYGRENSLNLNVAAFCDGKEIVEDYKSSFDIIILDIEMPQIDGMSAAEKIRALDEDVVLVFITNMSEYALRGYAVDALDFILKPVEYETFALKMNRVISRARSRERAQLLLTTAEGAIRIEISDIHYIEVQSRVLYYHTKSGVYKVRSSMQKAEKELEGRHFIRCNYWYLVNLRHVLNVHNNTVIVAGNELEISRRNRAPFLKALTNYMGGDT